MEGPAHHVDQRAFASTLRAFATLADDDDPARYCLAREIGRGGMGVIYEAVHLASGKKRAVKLLDASSLDSADAVGRLMREARAASMLTSPHATRVFSYGMTRGGTPYIMMELLEGVDLATYIADASGRIPIDVAIDIVVQLCDAVSEMHSYGMVHRDLKPSNVFLTQPAEGRLRVKLLDFGLAKLGGSDVGTRTCSGVVFGTPQYMSPEQLKSSTNVDPRTDVWALGAILCELVFGGPPFRSTNVAQLIASILSDPPKIRARDEAPSELRRIVLKCLEQKPRSRYANAAALRSDLERAPRARSHLHDLTANTTRSGNCERTIVEPPPEAQRWTRLEWTAACLTCAMMLAAGILTSAATRPGHVHAPTAAHQRR